MNLIPSLDAYNSKPLKM